MRKDDPIIIWMKPDLISDNPEEDYFHVRCKCELPVNEYAICFKKDIFINKGTVHFGCIKCGAIGSFVLGGE